MKKYKEAPVWWYIILLVLSFVAGESHIFIRLYRTWLTTALSKQRADCCPQGSDDPSLVVLHYCAYSWCIYNCKSFSHTLDLTNTT